MISLDNILSLKYVRDPLSLSMIFAGIAVFSTMFAFTAIRFISSQLENKKSKPKALNQEEWISFKLIQKDQISHDVVKFRFALQDEFTILGLPIGQHISLRYTDQDNKIVQRSYTPVTSDDEVGYVDFIIKVYLAGVHPKFPDGGKMSQYLNKMTIGDEISMKGPKGHLEYRGNGNFTIKRKQDIKEYNVKKLGLVAGGTGLTPMLQIMKAIIKDPKDNTEVFLIFANQTEKDILLREELDEIERTHQNIHIRYTIDRPSDDWEHSVGFIDKNMCQNYLPAPSPSTLLLLCGPPPMIKFACEPAFRELGFVEDQWYAF